MCVTWQEMRICIYLCCNLSYVSFLRLLPHFGNKKNKRWKMLVAIGQIEKEQKKNCWVSVWDCLRMRDYWLVGKELEMTHKRLKLLHCMWMIAVKIEEEKEYNWNKIDWIWQNWQNIEEDEWGVSFWRSVMLKMN